MTEMELFEQNIPMIAEMVVEARKMDRCDYEDWKREMLGAAADSAKPFISKLIQVIDTKLGTDKITA